MKIRIEYCDDWNYLPKAASLATKILTEYGNSITELTLTPSSGGVFEIDKDGKEVHSKKNTGNFPNEEQIIEILSSL